MNFETFSHIFPTYTGKTNFMEIFLNKCLSENNFSECEDRVDWFE